MHRQKPSRAGEAGAPIPTGPLGAERVDCSVGFGGVQEEGAPLVGRGELSQMRSRK